ncbi:hypothetical protein [Leucobacter sp. W1038]|uniref:hypothetical protein n=1 Tax=Leucobacter sp. W1038 TaxID=3438281 RepID=UPI003D995CD7
MIDETAESSTPNPETLLGVMLEDAGRLMNQASGGASACSFTKAGISVPSLKYAEGRWAALRELRSQGADREAAERLGAQWREQLAALEAREASRDWLAYRSGGVDALAEFAERAEPY